MKNFSKLGMATALLAGTAFLAADFRPAGAQIAKAQAEREAKEKKKNKGKAKGKAVEAAGRQYNITPAARPAIVALDTAVKAKNEPAYPAALAAALAVATTPDEKYLIAKYKLTHALNTNNAAEQLAAFQEVIASGAADAVETPKLHQGVGILAFNASNWQLADQAFGRAVELMPTDANNLTNWGLVKVRLNQSAAAGPLFERAIAATRAAGQPVPESLLRNLLQIRFEARQPSALVLSREVLTAFPTPENWRNSLIVYRDFARADEDLNLDIMRLMRASGAMTLRQEFYELATAATDAGLPNEAKAALDASVAARVGRTNDATYTRIMALARGRIAEDRASLAAGKAAALRDRLGTKALRTGDAYLSYGEYAEAITLYRAALTKGADANLVNSRIGIAAASAGNRAEAETAFRAVTGPRAELAALWLRWLTTPITAAPRPAA